jgi:hypothetical protein
MRSRHVPRPSGVSPRRRPKGEGGQDDEGDWTNRRLRRFPRPQCPKTAGEGEGPGRRYRVLRWRIAGRYMRST